VTEATSKRGHPRLCGRLIRDLGVDALAWPGAVLSADGGSRGNPGPAAIGYVIAAADGTVLAAHREAIGIAAATTAEYRALLSGLKHASSLGLDQLDARCDARLVVEHVTGSRQPTNPRLRELCQAIQAAAENIGSVIFTWVPAEANAAAHALVAEVLGARRSARPALHRFDRCDDEGCCAVGPLDQWM
jgi:probable phosphoglycerate mutase